MPSRIPSSLTPSSSTSSSASSSFVPYSAFTAPSTRDPLSLHNTATAAALGLPDLTQFAALRDTRSQSLGSSLSSSRDEYEHLSYTPIYPSYSSSFSNSSLEFHESLLLAIRERQQQLNRMRADSSTTTTTTTTTTAPTTTTATTTTTSALLASNIAGDFHTTAPRPSTTVSEALEQEQLQQQQQQDIPTSESESLPPIPDTLHSDTPVTVTDASPDDHLSTLQDTSNTIQPILELALNPSELDPSFHDSFPAGGPQDDRSQSIDSLTTSLMRSRAFSDLGPNPEAPFQPLLAREAPLTNDTHHHPPTATTTTTTTTTTNNPPAAPPPRGLPRRRYTTRDYSSGPLSANDWLRHPDVVSFSSLSTATPSEPVSGTSQGTPLPDTTHENQENIPPLPPPGTTHTTLPDFNMGFPPPAVNPTITPRIQSLSSDQSEEQAPSDTQLAQDHNNIIRMFETLGVAPAPPLATMDVTDHTTPQPLINTDQDRGPPPVGVRAVRADETTLQRPPTSSLETNHPDRLGLLGPLLSGTSEPAATTATTTSSTEPLDFSLLESARPGLNSTILSMASRIRQARIARLLRLVGERDSTVGYRERYAWNRMAHADTRSMVNHASGSRGTSRADSLEDGLADLGLEGDSQETTEDTLSTFRNRDHIPPPPSHFHPANGPSFAEILDCNGNPIDWSNSNSYASSSASSSLPSLDTTEDGDEDLAGWGHATTSAEQRRRRRGHTTERHHPNHGTVGGHRRPRILTTGTAFEGMEHISEADSMLLSNDNYRSLKGSWLTNPNGECWSDDEEENPLPSRRATDTDDKDQEVIFTRRGQPSLGVLQPSLQHQQGSNSANSLYYIYGNVRNRYGPEVSSRRQRVLSEMTDLLQREQEWEREMERYNRELLRTSQQQLAEEEGPAGVSSSSSSSIPSLSTATGSSTGDAESSSAAQVVTDTTRQQQQAVGSTTNAAPNQNGMLPGSEEGFMEYEQGHSQYHTQNVGLQGYRFNRSLGLDRAQPQAPLLDQTLSFHRQPSSAPMNRTPPLLPTQPRENEPIPHQIRRAHTSHMVNLQRRWEQQQQLMHSQRLPPSHGAGGVGGGVGGGTLNSTEGDQDMTQRYPPAATTTTTTFVPPPSQQELRGHTYSSQMVGGGPMAPLSSLMAPPVPMSRGNRSSFRTSHETSGFQNFLLSGIVPPLPQPTTATTTTTTTGATTRDPLVGSSFSSSSSATSATLPAAAAIPRASSTLTPTTDSTPLAAAAAGGTEATSDDPNMDPNQYYWRTQTIGGSSSLYTDYEGGTLKPEERWRRGKKEMVGR
ncbi:MAG: hypothetical protein J3Q66DRAFT_437743 [Benniella sp.]|nr:MAG: hypothetical protein J3Q66DRAFT_437743 [Benniella sp.]